MAERNGQLIISPWVDEDVVWDTLFIDGEEWPGLATVTVKRGNRWDRKVAKGSHGETQTYTGASNADLVIKLRIWTTDHFVAMRDLLPTIEPEPGKEDGSKPHDILHPVAEIRKVKAFIVLDVDGPKPDREGTWAFTISGAEYRQPESKGAKGNAVGGGGICAQLAAIQQQQLQIMSTSSDFLAVANAGTKLAETQTQMTQNGCHGVSPAGPPEPEPSEFDEAVEDFFKSLGY